MLAFSVTVFSGGKKIENSLRRNGKGFWYFAEFCRSSGAEEKVTKLQEALKEVQTTHIKEVDEMNTQLERQRQRTEELTEAVSRHLLTICTLVCTGSFAFWY